jgi:hypothetical protein
VHKTDICSDILHSVKVFLLSVTVRNLICIALSLEVLMTTAKSFYKILNS